MTTRRLLVLLALTVAVILGSGSTAANATFADSTALPSTTVGTATVAAPANVTAELMSCSSTRGMRIAVAWEPSASAGVRGYLVQAYLSNGRTYAVDSTSATESQATVIVDKFAGPATSVALTVTTLTSYGWTATSPRTSALTC
ncbi:hypothetical protein [Geodermatophilus chilensis]|uniref:hypothetical protein n=1 Tax=Geodermatophilus chilensis TaxID=2035835 RepID=UPI000C262467|nr:hypothetical protein [Geodermatophilus chilensis]